MVIRAFEGNSESYQLQIQAIFFQLWDSFLVCFVKNKNKFFSPNAVQPIGRAEKFKGRKKCG